MSMKEKLEEFGKHIREAIQCLSEIKNSDVEEFLKIVSTDDFVSFHKEIELVRVRLNDSRHSLEEFIWDLTRLNAAVEFNQKSFYFLTRSAIEDYPTLLRDSAMTFFSMKQVTDYLEGHASKHLNYWVYLLKAGEDPKLVLTHKKTK